MVERIPTGIKGLDGLIEGGLPVGSITLVSGTPGTYKSILCSQIVFHNALKGKKCLYLNLEQSEGRLEEQMKQFGWDPEKVKKNLKIVTVDSSDSQVVEYILQEIKKLDYDLIVLDSLDSISSTPLPQEQVKSIGLQAVAENVIPTVFDAPTVGRLKLKKIFNAINKSKATAIVISERVDELPGLSRDTISEFLSDGIIYLMDTGIVGDKAINISVKKMRLTSIKRGFYPIKLNSNGLDVNLEEGSDLLMKWFGVYALLSKLLISRKLVFDEGKISLFNQPYAIIGMESLKEMTDDAMERGLKAINDLYFYGWAFGYSGVMSAEQMYGLKKFEERYKLSMDIAALIGFGDYKTLQYERKKFSKFKVFSNPFALQFYPSNNLVDHYLRGINAGGGTAGHEKLMQCIELDCAAKNKKECVFVNATEKYLEQLDQELVQTQLDLNYLKKKQIKYIKEHGNYNIEL